MNKFKHYEDPRKNLRHEEMQLIGILDKCTRKGCLNGRNSEGGSYSYSQSPQRL
jgi:hypothetical protein